ncbi:Utp14 protein-domain-containing protein [Suillus paluster]|uniref:Utp14 protein-domain-containing protein n=1 Tax=Suillus paluster TaxID=48578 RepID=UPI001B878FCE|nr:Utp14 protein-domain-containing protein [Suillus paluster]KAG1742619.1 Utp14 protein-domain-containing protein [Suillus paluster]
MSARVKSSRTSKPDSSKLRNSLKKSNAAGYAKRHSQKSSQKGKATVSFDDVYEYAPSKVRRAKIGLELDREEATDRHNYASDDDVDLGGMGQEGREGLRARLLGENADDERVDSGDDEEIESDDAFEESDEEKYAGFDFSSKRSKTADPSSKKNAQKLPKRLPEVDLNEDSDGAVSDADSADELEDEDEEMEDGDAENFFDVLQVFDGKADENEVLEKRATEKIKAPVSNVSDEASELEDDGMSEDEQDEEGDAISASEDEASPEALAELESFLSKLDPAQDKKRKSDDALATQSLPKKRRLIEERTEAGAEGEFGVSAGGSRALKLDDLLAPLTSSSALTALKQSTKPLTSTSTKTKTLSAPLPQRAQERLDREAAYEQTKEEVDKWSATMKHIKQAEHLSFPLQAQPEGRVSNLELAAKFKPSNELESAVDNLLKSAQLRDQDIAGTEALKMAHLSVEEVAARRAELRMMRELAFRADKKAKRIAKIKSKAYRRIRKKQRERLDGEEGDQEDDTEDAGARLKAEVERARERATLRHKTTGKWAKAMQGREGLDVDQRQAIGEMLERGEKLRRRIQGEMSGDESEESESDDEDQDIDTIKKGAFEELATLNASEDAPSDLKSKSVFNMKFMRDAAARQLREADEAADDFLKEMGGAEQGSDDDASGDGTVTKGPSIQRIGGRMTYRPTHAVSTKPVGSRASETSSVTLQSADLVQDSPTPSNAISSPRLSSPAPESNPWLVASSSSGLSRKRSEVLVQKGEQEQDRIRDDAVLEIDASKVLTVLEPASTLAVANSKREQKGKGKEKTRNDGVAAQPLPAGADDSDGHSEVDEQECALERKRQGGKGKGVAAFKQRELVSLAFAGDNVVQTFEDLKQKEIEADAPQEVDTTLPGWGSWGGTGTKKLPPRPNLIKKIAGVDPSSRADYKKAHIIISERRDKKAVQVPRAEWNTRVGFQRGTLPRVVKKASRLNFPTRVLLICDAFRWVLSLNL